MARQHLVPAYFSDDEDEASKLGRESDSILNELLGNDKVEENSEDSDDVVEAEEAANTRKVIR